MRARYPDVEGLVESGGVGLHYEVYGDGAPTLLLIPAAPSTHSRIWKAQIHFLARRYRVVTIDGRGNGRSDRPVDMESYTRAANVADIVAVMDATATDRAVIVAHCHANWWALDVIAEHAARVQ